MLFPDLVIPVPLIPAENHCDPALLPDALQWVASLPPGRPVLKGKEPRRRRMSASSGVRIFAIRTSATPYFVSFATSFLYLLPRHI